METVLDPFNGQVAGQYESAGPAAVDAAIAKAHSAFAHTRAMSGAQRSSLLSRIADLICGRREPLAQLIRKEAGKPIALARAEVERAGQTFRFAAQQAAESHDRAIEMDASPAGAHHTGIARRVPIGVILGISPFNFPLNLVAHKVAPCIATGNTMVLKPSPRTPLAALALAAILAEAGAPDGQIQIVPFDHRHVSTLLGNDAIKMLTFTGSAAVGWQLKGLAVRQKVTLELGGNAAAIIHSDSAWAGVIPMLANAAFGYAGQSCISVQRILVHSSIYDAFRDAFVRHVEKSIVTGDPASDATINGPMIDAAARDRVLAWTREAIEHGARSALPLRHEGNCLWPIILEDAPRDCRIVAEEAFGPVAVLSRYADFDAALEETNASRYGLQAGVFTANLELAERAWQRIDAGAVLVNQAPTFRVENMPYGGVKESGFGREGIRYAMEEMTEWKTFIVRLPAAG
ncbi:MAG TPA: aldehyde dehydrogenase family protein [Chthoniobacteraceae bacterium]|jgi:glyceraldehyde-3-phosphate dehydrogenase (NADP+)|nr:aldehyde dehydrogenase family protein [Chthoniobacteraceae bacterium]